MAMTGAVIGGAGVLGRLICRELLEVLGPDLRLRVCDYDPLRGLEAVRALGDRAEFVPVDVTAPDTVAIALEEAAFAVVAVNQRDPRVQEVCIRLRVPCIDVTAFEAFHARVMALEEVARTRDVPLLLAAGFFPGLSGLLAQHATRGFEDVRAVHLGLLQNTNARAGRTGVRDMLRIISADVPDGAGRGTVVPGFTRKRRMRFGAPFGERAVRLIDHAEARALRSFLGTSEIRYWTGWNSRALNGALGLFQKVGLLARLPDRPLGEWIAGRVSHDPARSETVSLAVEAAGVAGGRPCTRSLVLRVASDYGATARAAALMTRAVLRRPTPGVRFPFECMEYGEVFGEEMRQVAALEEHATTAGEGAARGAVAG